MSIEPVWLSASVAALLGAILASFFTVVGERQIRGETLGGRSHCVCGRQLLWWQNLPIVGYVHSGGVAPCCGQPIPGHYLAAELGSALVVGIAAVAGGVPGAASALAATQVTVWAVARRSARGTTRS
jgi:prepilin signal peptidase PulO-like enzyme (type II secretory pathway)